MKRDPLSNEYKRANHLYHTAHWNDLVAGWVVHWALVLILYWISCLWDCEPVECFIVILTAVFTDISQKYTMQQNIDMEYYHNKLNGLNVY